MARRRGRLRVPVNGEPVEVAGAPHLRCPACREVVLRFDDARRLDAEAIAVYRRRHGFLSADEIRSIRRKHRLAQAELARLMRLGANTISRWESGRNVQTPVMDVLLRMIRDLPGTLEWLRGHAA